MRRALRWAFHAIAGLTALVLFAAAVLLAVLHTDWGREKVRGIAEAQLDKLVNGDVELGPITGSVLTRFTVHGIVVRDRDGEVAVRARRLLVDFDLLSLLKRRIRIDWVEVDAPFAARDLAGLWKKQPAGKPTVIPTSRPSWTIQLGSVKVVDGLLIVPLAEGTLSLAGISLDARIDVGPTTRRFEVARASAIWLERGLPVEAHGSVVHSDPLIALAGVEVIAGGSRLAVPLGMIRPAGGGLVAVLGGLAHEADVFLFWPHAVRLGDASFRGAVIRVNGAGPLEGRISAQALGGELTIAAAARLDVARVKGELHLRGVESPLARVPAKVDVDADFELAGQSLATLRASIDLKASGMVMKRRVDRLELTGSLAGGLAHLDAKVASLSAHMTAHADVRLGKTIDDLVIQAASLRGQVRDLGKVAARPDLDGDLDLDVKGSGTLHPLAFKATGKANLRRVRLASHRADSVGVLFDATGLPHDPRGYVNIDARRVVTGQVALGRIHARAHLTGDRRGDVAVAVIGPELPYTGRATARVVIGDGNVEVAFRDIKLLARGLPFRGQGGVVVIAENGRLSARDVALVSPAGSVRLRGDLSPAAGKLHIHAVDLDLSRLRAAFAPDARSIGGKLSADVHVLRDAGALAFEGDLQATAITTGDDRLPPVDATVRFSVGHRKLALSGHARALDSLRSLGVIDFAANGTAPHELLEAAGWSRIELEGARVAMRDVDLGALATLTGRPDLRGWKGRLDATLLAAPGGRALDIGIKVRGLDTPAVHGIDATVDGRWDDEALVLQSVVSAQGVELFRSTARLGAGLGAFADLRGVPIAATLVAEKVSLERLRVPFPILGRRANGEVSLDATLEGTLARPIGKVELRMDQARFLRVDFRDVVARAQLGEDRIEASILAHQKVGGSLEASGVVHRDKEDAIEGRVVARKFDLAFVPVAARRSTDVLAGAGGKLDADISVTRNGTRSVATGTIAIHGGSIHTPGGVSGLVQGIELDAKLAGGHVTIEKLSGQSASGTIRAKADLILAESLAPRSFTAHVVLDRFPVAAGAMVVSVSVDAQLEGRAESETWDMEATLRNTRIRVPEERRAGAPVQSVGEPADVVYVDLPDMRKRTALLALTGSPVVAEDGGLTLRLRLHTAGGVRVSGRELDLLLSTRNLTLSYRGGQPFLDGVVEANRGFIELFTRRYDVLRANASFEDNGPIDPDLDILLSHEFRATTLYVRVGGTAARPTLSLSADPGSYDQAQLLGWVIGGNPDDPSVGKRPLGDQAVGMASNMVLGQMQQLVKLALPIDVLSVRVGEGSDTQTTRFEVGKWLSESLFLGYIYRLNAPDDKNLNEAEVQYRLGPRWLLEAFFGDRGVAGADIIWSKKY